VQRVALVGWLFVCLFVMFVFLFGRSVRFGSVQLWQSDVRPFAIKKSFSIEKRITRKQNLKPTVVAKRTSLRGVGDAALLDRVTLLTRPSRFWISKRPGTALECRVSFPAFSAPPT